MSSFVNRLIGDDFIWTAISNSLTGKRRQSGTRFININCPMCVSRGETPDRKMRCGIKRSEKGTGVYCFNCGFKCLWTPGSLLSRPMRDFMEAIGIPEEEVKRLNLRASRNRSMLEKSPEAMLMLPDGFKPTFETKSLPKGAKSFEQWANEGCEDPDFIDVVEYLYSRGDVIANATSYFWSPNQEHKFNRRVIIPFTYEGRTVGYTSRLIDQGPERYRMEVPSNFLFNARTLDIPTRKYVILVEGAFDALAIDGVAMLGTHLNPQQAAWIKSYGKTVILVPDRDSSGDKMIDIAMENNWHVAFPAFADGRGRFSWWEWDVNDCAEAVKRYGRLWTLLSIIESATSNKTQIQINRKIYY